MQVNDVSRWMVQLTDNTLLHQVTMPGSHDAGMYGDVGSSAKTQSDGYWQQMLYGCRYFDTRLKVSSDDYFAYHGPFATGGGLGDIVQQTVAFLKAHQSEFVFIKLSKPKCNSVEIMEFILDRLDSLKAKDVLLTDGGTLAAKTVRDLRGKMILLGDDTFFHAATKKRKNNHGASDLKQIANSFTASKMFGDVSAEKIVTGKTWYGKENTKLQVTQLPVRPQGQGLGLHLFSSIPGGPNSNLGLCVVGKYSNDTDLAKVIKKQDANREAYLGTQPAGTPAADHLYAYYWTQTMTGSTMLKGKTNIKAFSSKTPDPAAGKVWTGAVAQAGSIGNVFNSNLWVKKPNIIMHDFVSRTSCTAIAQLNP